MHTIAIVLAGGKSSRMGVDKLRLPLGKNTSTTVLHHVVEVCNRVSNEVWLADTTMGASSDVNHSPSVGQPIRRVHDKTAYQGPLQAISNMWATVRENMPDSINEDDAAVLLVAGDLPGLNEKVLQTCRDILQSAPRDVDAVLVTREGRWQPLIGCYRIRCGLSFERIAQTGEPRLMRVMSLLHIIPVSTEEERWPDWWTKPIHTREEYQQWLDFYDQTLSRPESPA